MVQWHQQGWFSGGDHFWVLAGGMKHWKSLAELKKQTQGDVFLDGEVQVECPEDALVGEGLPGKEAESVYESEVFGLVVAATTY